MGGCPRHSAVDVFPGDKRLDARGVNLCKPGSATISVTPVRSVKLRLMRGRYWALYRIDKVGGVSRLATNEMVCSMLNGELRRVARRQIPGPRHKQNHPLSKLDVKFIDDFHNYIIGATAFDLRRPAMDYRLRNRNMVEIQSLQSLRLSLAQHSSLWPKLSCPYYLNPIIT